MTNPLTNLHRFITEHFDLEELRTLCFDLGIEYDDLGGEGRSDKARELLRRMGRRKELERLVDALRKVRPGAFDETRLGLTGRVDVLYDALPEFEAGSGMAHLRQRRLVFYSTLAFASLIIVVILVAGLIGIGAGFGGAADQLRKWGLLPTFTFTPTPTATVTPTPTPTSTLIPTPTPPFNPASEDEVLIVIASFYYSDEDLINTDVHDEIRREIEKAAAELDFSRLRVEVEPTRLVADDKAGAEALGKRYNASMVIWGADTGVRVTVNFLNFKQPDLYAAKVSISETERTQLANPSAYAGFVTEDLPGQLAFLSLFAVGQAYYVEEAYDDSIEVIEKAIAALGPEAKLLEGLVEAYFRLGWLYQTQGDDKQAIADYDRAIELDSDDAAAYYNRGITHYDRGDLDEAIADYDRAIELDPDYAAAYNNRGIARKAQGDLEGAIADYDRAIELDPDDAVAYYNRGIARKAQGDLEGAITDYYRAIELDSDYAAAYNNRGNARYAQGDLEGAIADFRRYLELRPNAGNRQAVEEWIAELEAQLSEP
jgi:tetratricopeptide (TPR) repeat protein